MIRPELEVLLDQYGLTRELLDDKESDWDDSVIPTEALVSMIVWRYVELGKVEYRVDDNGELVFRYNGNE